MKIRPAVLAIIASFLLGILVQLRCAPGTSTPTVPDTSEHDRNYAALLGIERRRFQHLEDSLEAQLEAARARMAAGKALQDAAAAGRARIPRPPALPPKSTSVQEAEYWKVRTVALVADSAAQEIEKAGMQEQLAGLQDQVGILAVGRDSAMARAARLETGPGGLVETQDLMVDLKGQLQDALAGKCRIRLGILSVRRPPRGVTALVLGLAGATAGAYLDRKEPARGAAIGAGAGGTLGALMGC